MPDRDLVVIGGGPAGLAVAIQARLAGLSVTVLDRARPPVDRACGEGMLPDTAAELAAMGVEPEDDGRAPLAGIRYLADGVAAEGRFGARPAWGVRRTALHAAMTHRAETLGADLRWGMAADGLDGEGVCTGGDVLTARVIVGADGRESVIRRWAGLDGFPGRPDRHAVRRHFEVTPWTDLVEVTWAEQAEAYVTPVGPRQVNVALMWNGAPSSFDKLLPRFPELARRLEGTTVTSKDRGASRLASRPRAVTAGRIALVGDAAGGLDPICGEGVSLAVREARALVEAAAAGDLARYARAHRRIVRAPRMIESLLLLLDRRPRVRRGAIAALRDDPALFDRLLAFHIGALPAHRLGLGATLRLVARALAGGPST
ncbi:MAG TPA: NAD(P)/FAD-dependent oxidoreductase [Thermoanaerobaculaceae bacterium]|nr:NAD(P)/FAD-dependent oxidoreductase [Thermoanaerobaculaceae bacterium]HPS77276.1 NAD(P)/FAD-dependent oxidoreductase [Thermoanaerobaculaceae bacterium]